MGRRLGKRGRARTGSWPSSNWSRGAESTQQDIERFRVESQAAAQLAHPSHRAGLPGRRVRRPALISPCSTSRERTLARKLADGPMPAQDAARLLVPVCRAVHYAHDHGVLHRDLKPSNILIDREGNPYVSDFGLAKRIDVDPIAHPSGALLGTPSYMPPEQAGASAWAGASRWARPSDVYSLGAILYHMLTGRPPFQAATPVETILLALEHDPIPPRALNPRVDPDLEMIALNAFRSRRSFAILGHGVGRGPGGVSERATRSRPVRPASVPWRPG